MALDSQKKRPSRTSIEILWSWSLTHRPWNSAGNWRRSFEKRPAIRRYSGNSATKTKPWWRRSPACRKKFGDIGTSKTNTSPMLWRSTPSSWLCGKDPLQRARRPDRLQLVKKNGGPKPPFLLILQPQGLKYSYYLRRENPNAARPAPSKNKVVGSGTGVAPMVNPKNAVS